MTSNESSHLLRVGLYDVGKTIGKGNFAVVRLATHRMTKSTVAIKIIDKLSLDAENLKRLRREVEIMKLLHHPNILKLYQVMESESMLYLVMEYAGNGEMFNYIDKHGRFTESQSRRIFAYILSAVDFCHRRSIVHRDLKTENILLDDKFNIKICDFGFGNFYNKSPLTTYCGSPPYAAPEVYEGKAYFGPCIDIWSLGVILYILNSATFPFDGRNVIEVRDKVLEGHFRIPYFMSSELEDLLKRVLVRNPLCRLTIDQIRCHAWLQSDSGVQAIFSQQQSVDMVLQERRNKTWNADILGVLQREGIDEDQVKMSLDNNLYDHFSAIYYLVAEKLQAYTSQERDVTVRGSSNSRQRRVSAVSENMVVQQGRLVHLDPFSPPSVTGQAQALSSTQTRTVDSLMSRLSISGEGVTTSMLVDLGPALATSTPQPASCAWSAMMASRNPHVNLNLLRPILEGTAVTDEPDFPNQRAGQLSSHTRYGYQQGLDGGPCRRHTVHTAPNVSQILQADVSQYFDGGQQVKPPLFGLSLATSQVTSNFPHYDNSHVIATGSPDTRAKPARRRGNVVLDSRRKSEGTGPPAVDTHLLPWQRAHEEHRMLQDLFSQEPSGDQVIQQQREHSVYLSGRSFDVASSASSADSPASSSPLGSVPSFPGLPSGPIAGTPALTLGRQMPYPFGYACTLPVNVCLENIPETLARSVCSPTTTGKLDHGSRKYSNGPLPPSHWHHRANCLVETGPPTDSASTTGAFCSHEMSQFQALESSQTQVTNSLASVVVQCSCCPSIPGYPTTLEYPCSTVVNGPVSVDSSDEGRQRYDYS